MAFKRPIAIGRIDYANAWPLFHNLEKHTADLDHTLVSRVPSELNRLLGAGELDVSAVSSYAYGIGADQYVLLPELSVGSVGKVHSILLFLKEPIEKRLPARIAVTTTSATSVNLLKIIMAKRFECTPEYIPAEPDLNKMLEHADGALLIGDPAIHASWRSGSLQVLDLGELWNNWTGLGMTYAVVAARKEAVESHPQSLRKLCEAFKATKQHNLDHPNEMIALACERLGGEPAYWNMYFQSLQYHFDERLQKGLRLYFEYAFELGLLKRHVSLAFLEEQSLLKVNE